ncbi:LysE family translocator [Allorhizobium borbori]|uniref:Threonine/homoserine/homoserine lactone efflux protein n=1 Tax=Allorhizobium borbori TaxID=485907 RepID=A0A7W6K2H9_9HYPH|nr:LysE family translocator [Allorhizobium borbori]MBB4104013.1 threonine/homoserine/homoserine lactone efflux protein [Allorhizobium borbori]PZU22925.1 MAG: LysE family translocator [Shinella sp.]
MEFLPSIPTFLAFAAATLLLAATPGPDMTLSISRALRDGRSAGLAVLIGTNLGCAVHTMLVAFGVSALVIASPTAFMILKTGGAAYLFWLAVQALRHGSTFKVETAGGSEPARSLASTIWTGMAVNLLNPKVIIFFMTFLPQFVSAGDPHVTGKLLVLGMTFIVVSLPVTVGVVLAADRLSAWLQRNPGIVRGIDYTFAAVFSLFAVKILFTQAR